MKVTMVNSGLKGLLSVADPECARGGGVSHILAEKRGVSFTFFQKNAWKCNIFTKKGGGRTPGTPYTPYAGSATVYNVKKLFLSIAFYFLNVHDVYPNIDDC